MAKSTNKIISYEEFAKQFNINNPEEFTALIETYQDYLKQLQKQYHSTWTYCAHCNKTVPKKKARITEEKANERWAVHCPECDGIWQFSYDKPDSEHGLKRYGYGTEA